MVDINTTTSIITLNINELNTPVETVRKTRPNYMLSETCFNYKDTYRFKTKGMEKHKPF